MIRHDPDAADEKFLAASYGYLAADLAGLEARRDSLRRLAKGRPLTVRENAILRAIEWGIAKPKFWAVYQKPRQLTRRPVFIETEFA